MRPLVAVIAALVVLCGLAPPVAAQAPETGVVVTTEAGYRSALTTLAADNSGPHTVTLGADITITGGFDPTYTGTQPLTIDGGDHVLSGGGTRRVLDGAGGLLTMTDIVVQDGFSAGAGGAVSWTGPARFERVEAVSNDSGSSGGAVRAEGDITVIDSRFSGNTVTTPGVGQGGAIQASPGTWTITATRSAFLDNAVDAGMNGSGGALRAIGAITLTDVALDDNTLDAGAGGSGGALSSSGVVTVTRAQIHDNAVTGVTFATGGAITAADGLTLVDTSVVSNAATSDDSVLGSAVNAGNGPLDLSNVTVAENVGVGDPATAAAYTDDVVQGEHATIVDNEGSTVANLFAGGGLAIEGFVIGRPRGGPNCGGSASATPTGSVDDDGTCDLAVGGNNASDVADIGLGERREEVDLLTHPDLLVPPAPTYFPLAGSPVVDRVATADCPRTIDVRGVERPFAAGCDAGSVEGVYPGHPFTDVAAWVEDAVRWMAFGELMTGITPTTFVPDDPITRAQVVRVLYREAGSPDVSGYPPHGFTDVPAWVEDAVRWAKGEGIATGITPTTFVPNAPITRAQVVRMKYRFAGSPPVSGLPAHPFTDVPAWVEEAVRWAANTDNPLPLVTGITPTTFKPNDPITRGQVARMDYRLALTRAAWADPAGAPSTMPFQPLVN